MFVTVPASSVTSRRLATVAEIAQDLDNRLTAIITQELQNFLSCASPVAVDITVTPLPQSGQSASNAILGFRVEGTGTGSGCTFANNSQQAQTHVNQSLQEILGDPVNLANMIRNGASTPSLQTLENLSVNTELPGTCTDNPESAFVIEFGERKNCRWLSCNSQHQMVYCQKPYYVTSICPHTCAGTCTNFQQPLICGN